MNFVKSPLNYTGNKFKLLGQLLPLFPENVGVFVDLFCGGGDVFANVQAGRILANDVCRPIMDLHRTIKSMPIGEILEYLDRTTAERGLRKNNGTAAYLEFRKAYNESEDSWHKPLDLFILSCTCFTNMVRFNSKGQFNMPHGERHFNEKIRENLVRFHGALAKRNIEFSNVSFEKFDVSGLTSRDFVYCDPPYLVTSAAYNNLWTQEDDLRLFSFLDELDRRGIRFGMSNVFTHKGTTNAGLMEWASSYDVKHLSAEYKLRRPKGENSVTDEVYVCNYRTGEGRIPVQLTLF